MTEADALEKIANAIEHLALAVGGLGTVAWLTLFFKDQSPSSAINHLAEILNTEFRKKAK